MYEHIGLANIPLYLATVRGLLADDGLFLNHAISRRAKRRQRRLGSRPEQRAIMRYIFPGGELDDIGHTVQQMEMHGLEVHDVENWRPHYALTTRAWCERLNARRAEAEAMVGPELVRIWLAYLAGVSLAFTRGTLRIYQTLVSKQAKGLAPVPPTRADLYR
jgi:cyclopropane-fatty-acyl-phospholipid synthase